jgi:DNA-binding transcriptional MocR family regulator
MAAKHREIRDTLLGRIVSGAWPPGAAIPHEAALAAEFGVTRPTISRALRDLVDGGLVERRRRAGSRVAPRQSPEAVLRIPVLREEIEAGGGRYGYRLLARRAVPPPAAVRARFGLPREAPALRLRALHLEDAQAPPARGPLDQPRGPAGGRRAGLRGGERQRMAGPPGRLYPRRARPERPARASASSPGTCGDRPNIRVAVLT